MIINHKKKKIISLLSFFLLLIYVVIVNLADGFFIVSSNTREYIDNITFVIFIIAAISFGIAIGKRIIVKGFFILLFLIMSGFLNLILQPAFEKIKLQGFWLKTHKVVENQSYLSCCDSILRNWALLYKTFATERYYDTTLPVCIKESIIKLKINPHVILVKYDKEVYIRLEFPNYAISCAMRSSHPLSLVGAKVSGNLYYTYSQRQFKTWQINKSKL